MTLQGKFVLQLSIESQLKLMKVLKILLQTQYCPYFHMFACPCVKCVLLQLSSERVWKGLLDKDVNNIYMYIYIYVFTQSASWTVESISQKVRRSVFLLVSG